MGHLCVWWKVGEGEGACSVSAAVQAWLAGGERLSTLAHTWCLVTLAASGAWKRVPLRFVPLCRGACGWTERCGARWACLSSLHRRLHRRPGRPRRPRRARACCHPRPWPRPSSSALPPSARRHRRLPANSANRRLRHQSGGGPGRRRPAGRATLAGTRAAASLATQPVPLPVRLWCCSMPLFASRCVTFYYPISMLDTGTPVTLSLLPRNCGGARCKSPPAAPPPLFRLQLFTALAPAPRPAQLCIACLHAMICQLPQAAA